MFSAISNFLFGGEKPPTETPLEYDIREDEEWMLVDVSGDKENMPASNIKRQQSVHNKSRNDYEETKKFLKNKNDSSDDTFEHISPSTDSKMQTLPYLKSFQPMDTSFDSSWDIPSQIICSNSYSENFSQTSHSPIFQIFKNNDLTPQPEIVTNGQQYCAKLVVTALNGTKVLYDVTCSATPAKFNPLVKLREITNRNKTQDADKTVSLTAIKSKGTCRIRRPLVEQKTPIKLPKREYMQQIQGLIQQQAKECQAQKYAKKAQLDRKNKAYLYDSSNKNQHRRDLWQNHSGANNNRKCY